MSFFKRGKIRKNKAKQEIIDLLSKTKTPVDANFFLAKIKSHRATIFRSLNQLVDSGEIKKLDFGEGKARFERMGDHHHHLVCENCGTIEKISNCIVAGLEKEVKIKNKFLIKRHSLEFFGLCPNCQ